MWFCYSCEKTEVYQVRLDSQEKKTGFCCFFKQLGITPAQAVRLFFKQVVLTKSIPFAIENQNINMEQLLKLRKAKASSLNQNASTLNEDDDHEDLFEELNALLGESDKT
ncbi:type II toxin-antitoxin system RelB/DinJ family antitoxin [Acinetobacter baumannii]|uniref:type II toxin-antitoxin system RelB/DinJ family antitoxin n=6 Tax=Acinetobacter baumannii TaxID=470 RepID=UPI00193D315B|nr:type II toxin-antitoxin system RelB/DinJ family antitoxin [Acinetobacter baumannii]QRN20103.1 type II toxin-antitoxin system RelB/DinJ family antitoxin [Acinetobacter baumannii]